MSGIVKTFLKNSFWLSIGTLSPTIAGFVLIPIYTRELTPAEFGVTDLINIIVTLLLPLLTLQIADSLQTFLLKRKYTEQDLFTNTILIVILGLILSLFLYPVFQIFFNEFTVFVFILLVISSFKSVLTAFAHGRNKISSVTLSGIVETSLLVALVCYFLLFLNLGINGYFYAIMISRTIALFGLMIVLKFWRYIIISKISIEIIKSMVLFSIPLIPNMIAWWINNLSDRYLIALFTNIENTGIYAVSMKLPGIVIIFNTVLIASWRITALENYDRKMGELFKSIHRNYFSVLIVILLAVNLLNEYFFDFYVGSSNYIEGKSIVPILILAMMFSAVSAFYGVIYLGEENTKEVGYTTIAGAICNIIINLLLIPKYGIYGAAIATFFSFFMVFVIRYIYVRKHTSIVLSKRSLCILGFVIMLTIVYKMAWIGLMYYTIIASIVILYTLYKVIKEGKQVLLKFRN